MGALNVDVILKNNIFFCLFSLVNPMNCVREIQQDNRRKKSTLTLDVLTTMTACGEVKLGIDACPQLTMLKQSAENHPLEN